MGCVKNTLPRATVSKEEDMNKVKNDVQNVKFLLNGKVCGAHVVGVC